MIINITNAKYNGKEYSVWCSISEDEVNYNDYMFKVLSPLEISHEILKDKIMNAWILKKTNVNLVMSYNIPEPIEPETLTELEIQQISLKDEISQLDNKIKELIESMKQDRELQNIYDDVDNRGFINTIDKTNMSDILRKKYNTKINEYTI